MARQNISAEENLIRVIPGEDGQFSLVYETDPDLENAPGLQFSIAYDSSVLTVEDLDDTAPGVQIENSFEFGRQGLSDQEDTEDIDNNPSTDRIINVVYTDPATFGGAEGQWPWLDPNDEIPEGQTFAELGSVIFQGDNELSASNVNLVLTSSPLDENTRGEILDSFVVQRGFDDEDGNPSQRIEGRVEGDITSGGQFGVNLRYSSVDPELTDSPGLQFSIAYDSSVLTVEDLDDTAPGVQIENSFEFGRQGLSDQEDTEDIDNNPSTDRIINVVYTDPATFGGAEGQWPWLDPNDEIPEGQTFADLGSVQFTLTDDTATFDPATDSTNINLVLTSNPLTDNFRGEILDVTQVPPDNAAPEFISDAALSIEENTITVPVEVEDADGDEFTLSLTGGADQDLFSIDAETGELSFIDPPDFEAPQDADSDNVYEVSVTADDGNGGTATQDLQVTVEDVNEAPEFVAPDPFVFIVLEFVGTSDGGNGDSDAPVQIEVNLLANDNGSPGSEVSPADINSGDSFFVEILASADDPNGISSLSLELDFDAAVLSAVEEQFNDATNIIVDRFDFGPGRVADLENSTITLAGGTADANTDENGDGIPDNVIGANGNPEPFALLQFEAIADPTDTVIDLEFPGIDDNGNPLGGSLGDGTSLSDVELNVQDFTFTATEEDDGTLVGTVEAEDPDEGDTVSFSLTGDVDDALFTIDASTGELRFNEAPDFEAPQDADEDNVYEVEVTATDGEGLTVSNTLTVTVDNVNEVPVAEDDTGSTDEDTVLTVQEAEGVLANDSDPDGDNLTVSAVNGEEANVGMEFELDSGALLTLNADGSYEYDPNGAFDDLNDGETATDTFTYTVADVNGETDTAEVGITVQGITDFTLDVDNNGTADPFTDGISIFRFLGELNPETFALADDATRSADEVQDFLEEAGDLLDVDGNGESDPFTDGTSIFRFLGELNPETFALADDATRTATEVQAFLQPFVEGI